MSYFMPSLLVAATFETARNRGLAWLHTSQKGDGAWESNGGLKVQASTAVLDAFMSFGIRTGETFTFGSAFVENARPASTDARARQLATLFASGRQVDALNVALIGAAAGTRNAWGALPGYSSGVLDTALASSTLAMTAPSYVTPAVASVLACEVIGPAQDAEGGWAFAATPQKNLVRPSSSDIVPTAYAVLALRALSSKVSDCPALELSVSDLIDRGIAYLRSKSYLSDGGAGDANSPLDKIYRISNIVDSALAARAIAAVDPGSPTVSALRTYLMTAQKANGSWGDDPFCTALALQAFEPVVLASSDGDGIPDDVKPYLGLDVGTPYRGLLSGNGAGVVGVNRARILAMNAPLGVPFGYAMDDGSVAGRVFSLVSGGLPDGLQLSGQGDITGTPTVAGNFNFVVRIQVAAQPDSNDQVGISVAPVSTATSIVLVADRLASNAMTPVNFTATVTGNNPAGRVHFFDGDTAIGESWLFIGDPKLSATTGVFSFSTLLRGGFPWVRAEYGGNETNQGSVSNLVRQVVHPKAAALIGIVLY